MTLPEMTPPGLTLPRLRRMLPELMLADARPLGPHAERSAEERGIGLGDAVGSKARFPAKATAGTLVKLTTDGILLAELAQDRDLLRYDTLIIDEAPERSLNIAFIPGYLRQLLPRRP